MDVNRILNKFFYLFGVLKWRCNPYRLLFKSRGNNIIILTPKMLSGVRHIDIAGSLFIREGARIEVIKIDTDPYLKIGDRFHAEYDLHIGCVHSIEIGHDVLIASRVYITDHDHGTNLMDSTPIIKRKLVYSPVKIGNNVWLGEGVVVLKGVEIGNNVIVGANSVVTRSIPSNSIAAGAPAKVIRHES